jgi:peptide/nickel transport system ATP-binding protein
MACATPQIPTSERPRVNALPILDADTLLDVQDLSVTFFLDEGLLQAVDGVSFKVRQRKTLGLVGESGCGKSVTAQAIMRIVPKPGKVGGKAILLRKDGTTLVDLVELNPMGSEVRGIRGAEIAMIFQEPMKAFSPVHTIGDQIMEGILLHATQDKKEAYDIAVETLSRVQISNVAQRMQEYPHQLSGGMRQRAMIAMALACRPAILIADEPTTALDVTVQAQVLRLMRDLQRDFGMALIFITHDMGVIAKMADEVGVMYLGRMVEFAEVDTIFHEPAHPYTQELLRSIPALDLKPRTRLNAIEGTVPVPLNLPPGCGFHARCKRAIAGVCEVQNPPVIELTPGHQVRCFLYGYSGGAFHG